MVSIAAFQAVDPGSIPGRRRYSFSQINLYHDQNAQVCCVHDSYLGNCGHNAGS